MAMEREGIFEFLHAFYNLIYFHMYIPHVFNQAWFNTNVENMVCSLSKYTHKEYFLWLLAPAYLQ